MRAERIVNGRAARRRFGAWVPGMTLIELLVVMSLAVIILSISIPAFSGLRRGVGMRTAINSLRSALSLSRQWAITHRVEMTVIMQEEVIQIYTNTSSQVFTNRYGSLFYAVSNGRTIMSTNLLPDDVKFDGDVSVTFKADGGMPTAVPVKITLYEIQKGKTDPTTRRELSVNGLTGMLRIAD